MSKAILKPAALLLCFVLFLAAQPQIAFAGVPVPRYPDKAQTENLAQTAQEIIFGICGSPP